MSESTFLSHVLWLGGPPSAAKTTIARELAGWHGLQLYHLDDNEAAHIERADPARKPALRAAADDAMTPEQRWLTFTPDELAYARIDAWSEAFEYALEDLLDLPKRPVIIAEGAGILPDLLLMVIEDPRQAVFLIPTPVFQREAILRAAKPAGRDQTTDPERATEALIIRDQVIAEHLRDRAEALGLTVIHIDGNRPVGDIAGQLELLWAPWLHL